MAAQADAPNRFTCSVCRKQVPLEYVECWRDPRAVVSVVGFPGHGKTVYFASLFYHLNLLPSYWRSFTDLAIDEHSLRTVREHAEAITRGQLPASTPISFPEPTVLRFLSMPDLGSMFFLFYDIGGEAFNSASVLVQNARFVTSSRTAIFMVSLPDIHYDGRKLHELLTVYIQGFMEIKGNPYGQNLVVVLTKGDQVAKRLDRRPSIREYLEAGGLEQFRGFNLREYRANMLRISNELRDYLREDILGGQFLNLADQRFRSVHFCILSSLGVEPVGAELREVPAPKRLLDPLLWVVTLS